MSNKIRCFYIRKNHHVLTKLVDKNSLTVSFDGYKFTLSPAEMKPYWNGNRFELSQEFHAPDSEFRTNTDPITITNITGAFDKSQFNRKS